MRLLLPSLGRLSLTGVRPGKDRADPDSGSATEWEDEAEDEAEDAAAEASASGEGSLIAQFETSEGERTGPQLDVPLSTTAAQLQLIVNQLLENGEPVPYSFYVGDGEVRATQSNASVPNVSHCVHW